MACLHRYTRDISCIRNTESSPGTSIVGTSAPTVGPAVLKPDSNTAQPRSRPLRRTQSWIQPKEAPVICIPMVLFLSRSMQSGRRGERVHGASDEERHAFFASKYSLANAAQLGGGIDDFDLLVRPLHDHQDVCIAQYAAARSSPASSVGLQHYGIAHPSTEPCASVVVTESCGAMPSWQVGETPPRNARGIHVSRGSATINLRRSSTALLLTHICASIQLTASCKVYCVPGNSTPSHHL
ncbi:hypothetical protein K491DRAFT_493896 [Lophiostoma macrostomum CBS 122681]|uniref:Uncharacterized protein n=1 Tax=Lophiostoma macrostomum CBS 122681 TaxID=1314788 RepID=A0A6A6T1Y9_9PLEO|nr:hypothetical protein K491DRAFT_493896 [Lophiostoma macrostomum CBS 122681]